MSCAIATDPHRPRPAALVLAIAVLLCGSLAIAGRASADELPPAVTNGEAAPSVLQPVGGEVTVSATITDADGVASASTELVGSNGTVLNGTLAPTGEGKYSGKVTVPPNFGGADITYEVEVLAADGSGNAGKTNIGKVILKHSPINEKPPVVSSPKVGPEWLPTAGGDVTIEATVTDTGVIAAVEAIVTPPTGSPFGVAMAPIGSDRYRAVYPAPAYGGEKETAYSFEVVARDDVGKEDAEAAGSIQQEGIYADPACKGRFFMGLTDRTLLEMQNVVWPTLHSSVTCPRLPTPQVPAVNREVILTSGGGTFFGTQLPPTFEEMVLAGKGEWSFVPIPVAQTAVAVIANPPKGCSLTRITNRQLERVWSGRFGTWSQLLTASGGAACNQPITRVASADASFAESRMKRYFARLNHSELPCGVGVWMDLLQTVGGTPGAPATVWPEGCPEAQSVVVRVGSNTGSLPTEVKNTPGTFGIVSLYEAERYAPERILELQNNGVLNPETKATLATATFASPAIGKAANCTATKYSVPVGSRPGGPGLNVDWSEVDGARPSIGGTAYPLCTLSFDVSYNGRKASGVFPEAFREYLSHTVLSDLGQSRLGEHWAAPLPTSPSAAEDVLGAARGLIGKVL